MISMMDIHNKDVQTLKRVKTLLEEKLGKEREGKSENSFIILQENLEYIVHEKKHKERSYTEFDTDSIFQL